MKVLVLGATGMLGYSLFKNLDAYEHLDVYGSARNISKNKKYFQNSVNKLLVCEDANDIDLLNSVINKLMPDVVINCIGLIKQHEQSKNHEVVIKINSLLPHAIAKICDKANCKLIHFSTDCCFDGRLGNYTELDAPNSIDLYGRSKILGEIDYNPHLTLRTSIIGHELSSDLSLIDWFLSQKNTVSGFSKAIFSGLPTSYIAELLATQILPMESLTGLYHLSGDPIDKYSLLNLVSEIYGKNIEINEDKSIEIDRSLDSSRLRRKVLIPPQTWPDLIDHMYKDYVKNYKF